MQGLPTVGLRGIAAVLAPAWRSLAELEAACLLTSRAETLAGFGFEGAHICDPDDLQWLALDAARGALNDAGVEPDEIDAVIWASARTENHVLRRTPAENCSPLFELLGGFRYACGWLQDSLHLRNATAMAVAQQGCSTMLSALRVARSLIVAEPDRCRHVLCVGVDALPDGAPREILCNVISDAACAAVVSRDCATERWLGFHQISRGHLWDTPSCDGEIVASYFVVARQLIHELLEANRLHPRDVDVVVPTGVNGSSWELLLHLAEIPQERLFSAGTFGHTMTSDSLLCLESLRRSAAIPSGSRLLLFTFGFGASWSGLLLEH